MGEEPGDRTSCSCHRGDSLERPAEVRNRTLIGWEVAVRRHLAPRVGHTQLQQLTRAQVRVGLSGPPRRRRKGRYSAPTEDRVERPIAAAGLPPGRVADLLA